MPARLRALFALTLSSIFLVSLLSAGSALAATTWLEPKTLSEPQFTPFGPEVGVDRRGEIVTTWFGSEPSRGELVQTSSRSHGGAWLQAKTLSPKDGAGSGGPDLEVSAGGSAVVVWEFDSEEGSEFGSFIEAAVRTGGTWSVVPLPKEDPNFPLQFSYFPKVAVNAAGDALAVWQECYTVADIEEVKECFKGKGEYEAKFSLRRAGGQWTVPQPVSLPSEDAQKLAPAISPTGDLALAWEDMKAKVARIALWRAGEGYWSLPQTLAPTPSGSPQVAFAGDSTAFAVWDEKDEVGDKRFHVATAISPPGGFAWTSRQPLSDPGFDAFQPRIGVTPAGDAVAVWETLEGGRPVQAAVRSAGVWQPAQNISAENIGAEHPRLAVNSAGAAVVAWRATGASGSIVQGNVRLAGGGWVGPQTLSEATVGAVEPDVAIDNEGSGIAVWRAATGGERIQAAGLDASGPRLDGLSIPASAAPGQSLAFGVAPADAWSAPGATTWSFGDGTGGSGTNVSHAYSEPGTYQVTVTSADALGNLSSAAGTVTVTSAEENSKPPSSSGGSTPPLTQQPPRGQKPKPSKPAVNGIARLIGAAAVRNGKAVLVLQCGRAAPCSGLARLVFQRDFVIGKSRFKISAGDSRTLRIALGPAALRLLEGSRGEQLDVRLEGHGVKAQKVVLGL